MVGALFLHQHRKHGLSKRQNTGLQSRPHPWPHPLSPAIRAWEAHGSSPSFTVPDPASGLLCVSSKLMPSRQSSPQLTPVAISSPFTLSPGPSPAQAHLFLLLQTKVIQRCLLSPVLTAVPGRRRATPSPSRRIIGNQSLPPTPEAAPHGTPPHRPRRGIEAWYPQFQHLALIRTLFCVQT